MLTSVFIVHRLFIRHSLLYCTLNVVYRKYSVLRYKEENHWNFQKLISVCVWVWVGVCVWVWGGGGCVGVWVYGCGCVGGWGGDKNVLG